MIMISNRNKQHIFLEILKKDHEIIKGIWLEYLNTNPSDEEIALLIDDIKDNIHTYLEKHRIRNILMFFIIDGKNRWIDILFDKLNSEQKKVLLQLKDANGHAAIHCAASSRQDDIELFKKLTILDDGNTIMKTSGEGNIALYEAALSKNKKIYEFLLSLGIPPIPKLIYSSFSFKLRLCLDLITPPIDQQRTKNEIIANIRSISSSPLNVLTASPSRSTFSFYVDFLSSISEYEVNQALTYIPTFLSEIYASWSNIPRTEQSPLKFSIIKLYNFISSQMLDKVSLCEQIILSFLRLTEVIPDIFPYTKEEKLFFWIFNNPKLYSHPLSVAYVKKIEDKNDMVKLILFYHFSSEKNDEYNPNLAIQYGGECLVSDDMNVFNNALYHDGSLFKDVFKLLKKEKQAAQAFELVQSYNKKRSSYQNNINELASLLYFAVKQDYQPAIKELINLLERKDCYSNKLKEVEKIKALLEKKGNLPALKKPTQSIQQPLSANEPFSPIFYTPKTFQPQPQKTFPVLKSKPFQSIIDQFVAFDLLPQAIEAHITISTALNILGKTIIDFDKIIPFNVTEEIAMNLKAKGLECEAKKKFPLYNSITIFLTIDKLENWLSKFNSHKEKYCRI